MFDLSTWNFVICVSTTFSFEIEKYILCIINHRNLYEGNIKMFSSSMRKKFSIHIFHDVKYYHINKTYNYAK